MVSCPPMVKKLEHIFQQFTLGLKKIQILTNIALCHFARLNSYQKVTKHKTYAEALKSEIFL